MKKISLLLAFMLTTVLFANETKQETKTESKLIENQTKESSESSSTYCETETYSHVVKVEQKRIMSMDTSEEVTQYTFTVVISGQCTTCYTINSYGSSVDVSCWGSRWL